MAGNRNDTTELLVGGTGQVYHAPVGTTLPTTATGALSVNFIPLGFHTDDGMSISLAPEVTDMFAWQSKQPVRREVTAQDISVTFALEQWNEETLSIAFGGGSVVSDGGTGYKYAFPSDTDSLNEFALVCDIVDGTRNFRFVWSRGNVTEAVETKFARSELAVLPISYKVLAPTGGGSPGTFYTDDAAAFAVGS